MNVAERFARALVSIDDTGDCAASVMPEARRYVARLDEQRRTRRTRAAPRRATKRAEKAESGRGTSNVRALVFARASETKTSFPRCEAWLYPHTTKPSRCPSPAVILDHWLGGSGKRKPHESVETGWALCRECNRNRTDNKPDAAWWNASFEVHATKHGYAFTLHIVHQPVARRSA